MAKKPYLYRRNNIYYFRFVVPIELRETLKVREIIKSLKTQNREVAVPLAFAENLGSGENLQGIAKRLQIMREPMFDPLCWV